MVPIPKAKRRIAMPKAATQANEVPIKTPVIAFIKCTKGLILVPKIVMYANGLRKLSTSPTAINMPAVATFLVRFDWIIDSFSISLEFESTSLILLRNLILN